jgi:hypothetical protein
MSRTPMVNIGTAEPRIPVTGTITGLCCSLWATSPLTETHLLTSNRLIEIASSDGHTLTAERGRTDITPHPGLRYPCHRISDSHHKISQFVLVWPNHSQGRVMRAYAGWLSTKQKGLYCAPQREGAISTLPNTCVRGSQALLSPPPVPKKWI